MPAGGAGVTERAAPRSEAALARLLARLERAARPLAVSSNPFSAMLHKEREGEAGAKLSTLNSFERMIHCQKCLAQLDTMGWSRSFHQRQFHDDFLRATAKSFWKLSKPGQFARDHRKILVDFNWSHLSQEILISTPRRFGKTIAVSMFAAAIIVSCPGVEISIYSTCKRISQKLLRNVSKFVHMICGDHLANQSLSLIRANMEELVVQGPVSKQDVRVINSYPSKASSAPVLSKSQLYALQKSTSF